MNNYRWSSYFDYIGKTNFPSVIQKDFILKIFAGSDKDSENKQVENIKIFAEGWIAHKNKLARGLFWRA